MSNIYDTLSLMDSLRRASAALFYALGIIVILGIIFVNRGYWVSGFTTLLNVLDLPLLLVGMLFGGSSLVVSLSKGNPSKALVISVFVPLMILFLIMMYLNFVPPFSESI